MPSKNLSDIVKEPLKKLGGLAKEIISKLFIIGILSAPVAGITYYMIKENTKIYLIKDYKIYKPDSIRYIIDYSGYIKKQEYYHLKNSKELILLNGILVK